MSFSAASLHAALRAHVPEAATGFVVALSGGADSASLLAAMLAPGEDFRKLPLRAVHIDHGLQAAAADFRDACTRLCAQLNVPLSIVAVVVEATAGESLEAAAREARYAALAAQLKPNECLLTAHHRKDQAETLLLQALRGAGVKGMSAMPDCRKLAQGWHVRPMLGMPQSELLQFSAGLASSLVTDPMNADLRFDRSFLRHRIWPVIEQRWPGAEMALSRTAGHLADAQKLLDMAASKHLARLRDGDALLVTGLRVLPQLERINAVRLWLCEARVEPPSRARLSEALRQVLEADIDQMPAIVWGEHALRRYRQRLFLTDAVPPRMSETRQWVPLSASRADLGVGLGYLTLESRLGGIAPEALQGTLKVRGRAGGEVLKPARFASTQSLQHLCQSLGVLPWMRDALPLVFANDQLMAVADLWTEARCCAAEGMPGFAFRWSDAPIMV
jgi:tRNA(Ile)-lysidine synthase